ncbi:MAG: phasin family protein [Rhodospirillaceae bacterium]|nr:phasin family protein [Rhodospirillaceae bacterium]
MKKNNPFGEIDVAAMMEKFKVPATDIGQMMAGQQKNMEAMKAASQLMVEGMQAMAQRQTQMLQQMMSELMSNGTAKDEAGEPKDKGREALRSMVLNMLELQAMATKSKDAAMVPIFKRMKEDMAEKRIAKGKGLVAEKGPKAQFAGK